MKRKNKFIVLSLLSIIFIYIINKLIFTFSTIKNNLYSYNAQYFQWRFGKIFYTKQGKGQPLLLIHDLNTFSSDIEWSQMVKSLQRNYTVYTIDLLGCGRSDKPKITYTSYLYVQLVTDFVKNIIKEPTHIVTSGSSTSFITMACYQNPYLFNKMMFINPTNIKKMNRYPRKRNQLNKKLLESPLIGTLLYNMLHSKLRINKKLNNAFYSKSALKNKYINLFHESSHINGVDAKFLYASIKNAYTNINIVHALEQINHSMFIVYDRSKEKSSIQEYKDINPSIETQYINNARHYPHIECVSKTLELIDMYFN
ncbi:pimeloyl-ACP methyl ester carboxylesterase [Natranaerovirga hydrolytica]|uniref:Pimeloyl-ACP methyl ester carboxylesterase n=1 Tax=Natranaerovirga hydrolytica TaxID=680378 RepID=A0A4R1M658_9FIRM|nr:alpha/beta fold hydrolase [Natranaerovirga hydrolytica]TCK86782.1 pimeloyl-ACP methyl ester carboxylesterase [Natranaerovirga hydrolytica]